MEAVDRVGDPQGCGEVEQRLEHSCREQAVEDERAAFALPALTPALSANARGFALPPASMQSSRREEGEKRIALFVDRISNPLTDGSLLYCETTRFALSFGPLHVF